MFLNWDWLGDPYTKPNTCEVIKTYSVRGKEKKGRIRELWRVAHLQWNLWFQRLPKLLPLGDLKIFFYGGMMEVHASAENAFYWNSYQVPLLGLHVRLPAGTGRFQLFEDCKLKLMWKPFHLYSRWWLNSSFWDHLGVWTLQIVVQTTGLNWYRFSAVASSMPGKVRWNRITMIDNQSCHSLSWIPQGVHQSQLGPIICVLAHIFVEISYIYQHDYPIEYRHLFFFLPLRMPRSAAGAVDQKEPSCGGRMHLGEAMRRWWKLTTSPRESIVYMISILWYYVLCVNM